MIELLYSNAFYYSFSIQLVWLNLLNPERKAQKVNAEYLVMPIFSNVVHIKSPIWHFLDIFYEAEIMLNKHWINLLVTENRNISYTDQSKISANLLFSLEGTGILKTSEWSRSSSSWGIWRHCLEKLWILTFSHCQKWVLQSVFCSFVEAFRFHVIISKWGRKELKYTFHIQTILL